jgi:3-deoxy-D-manno-octulosonate 8-phosphate phosphatase (KDO 8-P phosphatase)
MGTLVLDIDGVLTNGKQYITSDGKKLFKAFHSRDVAAIREFIFNGWRVILVTADNDPTGQHWADKVGAEFLVMRDKSKIDIKVPFVAVGDDAWDIPMLNLAEAAFCPADASYQIAMIQGINILKTKGGQGVVSELVNLLL